MVGDLRSLAEIDLADLTDGQLFAVLAYDVDLAQHRTAHRSGVGQPLFGVDRGVADRLRSGVKFMDDRPPPVDELALQFGRAGGAGVNRGFVTGKVISGLHLAGQADHAAQHGRHPLAVRHMIAVDGGQRAFGVELGHDDVGAADAMDGERIFERRAVIERGGTQIDAIGREAVEPGEQHRKRVGFIACAAELG